MSILNDIYELGARVWVRLEGQEPFESRIRCVVGNGLSADREPLRITVEDSQCPIEGIPAERVWRIYRVVTPDGRSYEGVCTGVVDKQDGLIAQYFMRPLHMQWMGEYVEPSQIEPLYQL